MKKIQILFLGFCKSVLFACSQNKIHQKLVMQMLHCFAKIAYNCALQSRTSREQMNFSDNLTVYWRGRLQLERAVLFNADHLFYVKTWSEQKASRWKAFTRQQMHAKNLVLRHPAIDSSSGSNNVVHDIDKEIPDDVCIDGIHLSILHTLWTIEQHLSEQNLPISHSSHTFLVIQKWSLQFRPTILWVAQLCFYKKDIWTRLRWTKWAPRDQHLPLTACFIYLGHHL